MGNLCQQGVDNTGFDDPFGYDLAGIFDETVFDLRGGKCAV